jgi:Domain of unknown function (DUF4430)
VTGEARSNKATGAEEALGRRWQGRPGSQETTSDHQAEQPSWKGWLMQNKQAIKAGATALGVALALVAAPVASAAAAAGPKVTVSIVGKSKTLLPTKTVQTQPGSITRGGVAAGKCSATSAQGALNVATHGNWKGTWSSSYHEYFITGILGDNEGGKKYYWGLYVNGKSASKGACDIKLKSGDKLLFKVTKA